MLGLIFSGRAAAEGNDSEFSVSGYLQNQTGYFFSSDKYKFETVPGKGDFPVDHGGYGGQLSMFRNTFQLEAEWKPAEKVTVFAIFRGVRSAILEADRYAQVPDPGSTPDPRRWVQENYYTENELRELYLDVEATDRLSFRLGRQQVAWGDTGQYRLLDVVNPIDGTWHFSAFESFKDTRMPLWLMKGLYDLPELSGSLEFVWMPALDRGEDMVTPPLTLVGAWGLPLPPEQEYQSAYEIKKKVFIYPDNKLEDSRLGANWKGTAGSLTYSLAYFYTHILSPPILKHAVFKFEGGGGEVKELALNFPRQHIAGFSLDYAFSYPVGTVVRFEAAVEPDRPYPIKTMRGFPQGRTEPMDSPNEQKLVFPLDRKPTFSYALVFTQPAMLRFLNPTQSTMINFQLFQTIVPNIDKLEQLIEIPGYDTTEVPTVSTKLILAIMTSYAHGAVSPMLVGIFDPAGGVAVRAASSFTLGNHWRLSAGVHYIWASDPYKGLGLFRDRDEIFTKVQYQF